MKKITTPIISILLFTYYSYSQVELPCFGKQQLLNGFAISKEGESLPYFSVYQDYAKKALLTRCTDGNKIIKWETSPIPKDIKEQYAYFSWIAAHSTGTSKGIRHFDLYINDKYILTFSTKPNNYPKYWSFSGNDSTRLVFEYIKKDAAMDAHGFAYLRVPVLKYPKGKPLKIKVVGQNQNSNDWYMTFEYSFEERIDITPLPFLSKDNTQPLMVTVLHFGNNELMSLNIKGKQKQVFEIRNGLNSFIIYTDPVSKPTQIVMEIGIGNILKEKKVVAQEPVISREIYLIHHSHTDIGYSHLQDEVVHIHSQNIRNALRYIEKTKDYPDGSKFVWNIESLWDVENFLSIANPNEKELFFKAVRNKQIVLTAFYANLMTGLCLPHELNWVIEYANYLRERYNLQINSTMFTDIPGLTWSIVPTLAKYGYRYFSNGLNYGESLPDFGDRIGSSMRELGDKPFWWKSSDGKDSILFWTGGKGYSSWHRLTQGAIKERGTMQIASYLNEINGKNYPYSIVQWRYNIQSDNGPTDSTLCDFVRDWNEKYSSPKLIVGNISEMFEKFEKKYGKALPTFSGDFTPYWEDGAYSTALEETENRVLSAKLAQLINLANQNKVRINEGILYKAKRNILMFHEHTWGAWSNISDPDSPFTKLQWDYKKRFVDSAKYFVDLIEKSLLSIAFNSKKEIVVYNTLNWARGGYVEVDLPRDFAGKTLINENNRITTIQHLSNGKIGFIADSIPAKGRMRYKFTNTKQSNPTSFESPITFAVDTITGAIASLKYNGKEFTNPDIHKSLLQALCVKGLSPQFFSLSKFKKIEQTEDGAIVRKYRVKAEMNGTNKVIYEITHYKTLNNIKFSVIIDKKATREKESIHIAFHFSIQKPVTRIGVDNTFITPEKGSIPGSNKDFYSVQNWIDVSNDMIGISISCPQAALFEVGNIVNELPINNGYKKWKDYGNSSSTIYLYAINNYWHTNFKAEQEGIVRYDFYLYPHTSFNPEANNRNAAEVYEPLIGVLD